MDPNEVLKQYIDMCNSRSGFFQYCLANNAILEWFGRTIRGRHKIYHYFRYDLCQQYEHNFYDAQFCEPIESRTTHLETKEIIEDNMLNETFTSKKHNNSDITPIQLGHVSPKLPRINRGLRFIPDADEELNELGLSALRDTVTPPPIQLNMDQPPIKKIKHSDCTDKKLLNIDDFLEISHIDVHKNNLNNPNNKLFQQIPTNNDSNKIKYSPLMYLEVNGTLRTLNRIKHRGVHTPTTSNNLNCTETNCTDLNNTNELITNSSSYWDRDTKLKISYRKRLLDQQIEFALIIYEHITRKPTTKRNLLSEFDETINDNKNELSSKKEILSKITKEHNIPPELKRKKHLKRLLRLF